MAKAARAPDRQRTRRSASNSAVKGFLALMIAAIVWVTVGFSLEA